MHSAQLAPLLAASRELAASGHDVVLVDAPCSSSGTLRRHPGLRWSGAWSGARSAKARDRLTGLQRALLRRGAALVRPGGRLVYATCSLDQAENEDVAHAVAKDSGRTLEPWPFDEGTLGRHADAPHYRTLWPHAHGTDVFFVARWRVS